MGSHLADESGCGIERGVYRAVESSLSQCLQQGQGGLGLEERLAPAERHAAPAVGHHVALFFYLGQQRVYGPGSPAHLQGQGGAFLSTAATAQACPAFNGAYAVLRQRDGSLRTGRHTALAPDALAFLVDFMRMWIPRLWVVAPYTTERAPAEEDGGADARPVVDGVSLDVEDVTLHHSPCVQ